MFCFWVRLLFCVSLSGVLSRTHTFTDRQTRTHTYTRARARARTHTHTHTHTRARARAHTCSHTHKHVRARASPSPLTHIHWHARGRTYIQTHIHTHARARAQIYAYKKKMLTRHRRQTILNSRHSSHCTATLKRSNHVTSSINLRRRARRDGPSMQMLVINYSVTDATVVCTFRTSLWLAGYMPYTVYCPRELRCCTWRLGANAIRTSQTVSFAPTNASKRGHFHAW